MLTLQDIPDRLSGLSQVKLEPGLLVVPEEALESLIPVFWSSVVNSILLVFNNLGHLSAQETLQGSETIPR